MTLGPMVAGCVCSMAFDHPGHAGACDIDEADGTR